MRPNRFTLMLAAVAGLAACAGREGPIAYTADELAEFMGTREERAARAPYSPPGWPLKRGDDIGERRLGELNGRFPHLDCGAREPYGIAHVFWVGDMAFGSKWGGTTSWVREHGDDVGEAYIAWMEAGGDIMDTPLWRYLGHFRQYDDFYPGECPDLPSHVRDRSQVDAMLSDVWAGFAPRNPEETWTEERWLAGYVGEGDDR
ncbi:MAG: hypothetical protein OXK74_00010 [Gemmatimonadota bacterium]|nr:hypothetical protein [Gemmatimonadota bacterium]